MRPPKDIWTNNYNDFILDLYDANPLVQKDNGTVKKAPEPEKNPKKVEATPEESDDTLTNLVGESLRLRNTAVLNLKLTKNIFKWEKERLAKIKPFPDSDPLDGKKVVIIEEDEDDGGGFKFPRFKFPKLPKLPKIGKIPNPFKKPSTETSPSKLPNLEKAPIPKKEKEKQPQLELPRIPTIPLAPFLPYLLPRFGEVADSGAINPEVVFGDESVVDSNSRTFRTTGTRLLEREVAGDTGRGGGNTATATAERPEGPGKGPEGKGKDPEGKGKGKGTGTSGGSGEDNLRTVTEDIDIADYDKLSPELRKNIEALTDRKVNRAYASYTLPELEDALKQERSKRSGNPFAKPSSTEKELAQAIEFLKFQDAELVKNAIPDSPLDLLLNESLRASADEMNAMRALPGSDPNAPKLPGSQVVPFDRGLQTGDLYSMIEPKAFEGKLDAFTDMFNMEQSGLSKVKTVDDALKVNQPPNIQKLLKSNTSFSFADGLKLPKLNLTGRALMQSALVGVDAGLVVYDYAQRKSEGQTDLQAVAGAGSSYAGGVAAQLGTGALITKYGLASMVTPVPGARPVGLFLLLLGAGVAGGYFGGKVSDAVTGVDKPSVKEGLNTNGVPVPEMDLAEELFSPEAIQQFEEMMKNIPNGGFAPQTPLLVPIPSFGNLSEFPSGNYNTWGHPTQGN